jgi:N-acetylglucosamine-6-phosphate deacetylase
LAGLPPGRYQEWGQDFDVTADGRIHVSDTEYLGGSSAFLDVGVGNVVRFAGVSLSDAIDMASTQPRALLGLPPRRIQVGDPADLIVFDWDETYGVRSVAPLR